MDVQYLNFWFNRDQWDHVSEASDQDVINLISDPSSDVISATGSTSALERITVISV